MNADKGGFPDPSQATDLTEYVRLLDQLRIQCGEPSYRTLAGMVGPLLRPPRVLAHSTLAAVFQQRRRRLDQDLLIGIVRALTADEPTVDRWREAYLRIQRDAKTGSPAGVFRQLPADLATFTGRQEDIARLIAAATHHRDGVGATTVVISAIEGMGGVGKTQLAIRTAHELIRAGHFADAQLHVNLRGFDPELPPADPSAVLEGFLRQLGVPPQQIPVIRGERAAMYRDQLRGRSALVLLDNAADEDQVRDLIPAGPSCLVLITSRRSLAGLDGITPHQLDTFTDAESLDLLIRIAGRDRVEAEPEAAALIVQYCDRLPLALALAAARLRSRPAWSLQEMADRLRAGNLKAIRAGGRAIRPVIELSYRELSEPLQRIFRLLGHHPGSDFTPAIVAALAGIPDHDVSNALESLQDENLIRQSSPGRYELHDLLRVFATDLAEAQPEPEPAGPLIRLATWAVATSYAASLAIGAAPLAGVPLEGTGDPEHFATYNDGLTWFDRERHNIAMIQESAAQAGLHRLVWQLALVQKDFRIARHQYDDFLAAHHLGVAAAQASHDPAAEALMLSGIGSAYWRMGRPDEAENSLQRALQIYSAGFDPAGEGSALLEYGAVQAQRKNNEGGLALFSQAIDKLQSGEDSRSRARALMNRGVLYERMGRLDNAIADTCEALAIHRQLDDRRSEAVAIGNLAWFGLVDGDIDSAINLYGKQHHIALLLDDIFLQADALFGVGETHATAGHPSEARDAWQEALRLFKQIGHPRATAAQERLDATEDEWPSPWTPTDWAAP